MLLALQHQRLAKVHLPSFYALSAIFLSINFQTNNRMISIDLNKTKTPQQK